MKTLLFAVLFGQATMVMAQSNVFLERSYWKTTTTVADVEAKMKAGNDIVAKNGDGYDAVTFAILQGAPTETIAYMVALKGNEVNKITNDGRNYIFWASAKANLPVMQILVDNGSRLNIVDTYGNSPLTFAAANGVADFRVYDFLIANGCDVNFTQADGATALLLIVPYDHDFTLTKYFLNKGLDLYATDTNGNSAFNYAALTGNTDMMRLLIEKDVAYKTLNKVGGNATLFAAKGTQSIGNPLSVYEFLESNEVEINVTTVSGTTPLHILAEKCDDMDVLKYFMKKGVDIEQVDANGDNVLMVASKGNTVEVVEFFADRTFDINAGNSKRNTALNYALAGNTTEVVVLLQGLKAKTNRNSAKELVASVYGKNQKEFNGKLDLLKSAGFDPTLAYEGGNTMLHYAAPSDNVSVVRTLINEGIDVNAVNNEGYTALQIAAMKSTNIEVLQYLVEKGADTQMQSASGQTAYELASENEFLSKNGVELSFLN